MRIGERRLWVCVDSNISKSTRMGWFGLSGTERLSGFVCKLEKRKRGEKQIR